ncbi:MAG: hypothetical protein D6820_09590 [Lentisphaerae bacterium]|nr:MAG: hypothetical protein D6820_09590 [Lentisphaerota bacterium]
MMTELLKLPLFRFGGKEYTLDQFFAWAEYTEALIPVIEHLQKTEEAVQSGFEIDQERIQQAVNEFRYHNNLITSAETHRWLRQRNLEIDDLYTHIYRKLSDPRKHLRLTPAAWKKRCLDPVREVWAELHFTAKFQRIFDDFVLRISIASRPEYYRNMYELKDVMLTDLENMIFLNQDNFHFSAFLEHVYREYVEENVPRSLCEAKLRTYRIDLLKILYESISFKDLNAAKEAYCCVRYDGESLQSLAKRTGGVYESEYAFIEDIPELLRAPLLSAKAGECLDPLRITPQRGYTVLYVTRKTEPHVNNIQVRERLERKVIEELLADWNDQNFELLPWNR